MTEVKFYERIEDELLKFAVIISKTQNKYIFCKHKDRDTWEVPGGHRESQENIIDTAKRELYEETGALEFDIEPVCVYSVTAPDNLNQGDESFGMLFFANIKCFETELHSEIEKITIMDGLPARYKNTNSIQSPPPKISPVHSSPDSGTALKTNYWACDYTYRYNHIPAARHPG